MNSRLCDELGIEFPLFAFSHCFMQDFADAAERLADAVGE